MDKYKKHHLSSYEDAVRDNRIEKRIKILVEALNGNELKTISSCEGHCTIFNYITGNMQVPFVLFHAPVELAQKIGQTLTVDPSKNGLNQYWTIYGYFYPPEYQEMIWNLHADIAYPVSRNKIDQDIKTVTELIIRVIR